MDLLLALQKSLIVCTADLCDFPISLIFLVELGIYHSLILQAFLNYRDALPLPRQGVVNSLCAFPRAFRKNDRRAFKIKPEVNMFALKLFFISLSV